MEFRQRGCLTSAMAVRPVVITGDPVLHRPASRIGSFDGEVADIIKDMFDTMDAAHGVGLAAPQIGLGLRLFVYEMANDDGVPTRGVVVNPIMALGKIAQERPDPDLETEGCLSVPGESFPLKRAERARVSGFDAAGAPLEFDATGWFARCMQHEFDHLNGKLYVDRLDERHLKKARKAIRRNGWGAPGRSWMPGVDVDPFGHDDEDLDEGGHDEHLV